MSDLKSDQYPYHDPTLVSPGFEPMPPPAPATKRLTGLSSDYYQTPVDHPTSGGDRYVAECNDVIEALQMNFAEGNIFKAIWRMAAARMGNGKPGNTSLYDAEKVVFFGKRLVAQNTNVNNRIS